jgi:putative protein-disulfide isomerase
MTARSKIIYFFDPLCGWCYGFSEVISSLYENYQDRTDFQMVLGGMIVGEREGPIGEFANYILDALPRLQNMTGVSIGDAFKQSLRDQSLYQSSVKPSKAIITMRQRAPQKAFQFARAVQQKQFIEGHDLQDNQTYEELAQSWDVDPTEFLDQMQSTQVAEAFERDQQLTQQMGVQGFPTLVGKRLSDEQYQLLAHGYATKEVLETRLTQLLDPAS